MGKKLKIPNKMGNFLQISNLTKSSKEKNRKSEYVLQNCK